MKYIIGQTAIAASNLIHFDHHFDNPSLFVVQGCSKPFITPQMLLKTPYKPR
jgi:hypothetical protein